MKDKISLKKFNRSWATVWLIFTVKSTRTGQSAAILTTFSAAIWRHFSQHFCSVFRGDSRPFYDSFRGEFDDFFMTFLQWVRGNLRTVFDGFPRRFFTTNRDVLTAILLTICTVLRMKEITLRGSRLRVVWRRTRPAGTQLSVCLK